MFDRSVFLMCAFKTDKETKTAYPHIGCTTAPIFNISKRKYHFLFLKVLSSEVTFFHIIEMHFLKVRFVYLFYNLLVLSST